MVCLRNWNRIRDIEMGAKHNPLIFIADKNKYYTRYSKLYLVFSLLTIILLVFQLTTQIKAFSLSSHFVHPWIKYLMFKIDRLLRVTPQNNTIWSMCILQKRSKVNTSKVIKSFRLCSAKYQPDRWQDWNFQNQFTLT